MRALEQLAQGLAALPGLLREEACLRLEGLLAFLLGLEGLRRAEAFSAVLRLGRPWQGNPPAGCPRLTLHILPLLSRALI